MKILLLEDDKKLASWLEESLNSAGHVVDHIDNGREALAAASVYEYDLLVLDRMVPGLDGVSVLKALRAAKVSAPALFLSAMGDVDDRVDGLEAGDDYLVKPFAISELLARVSALGRRSATSSEGEVTQLRAGELQLDLLRQRCRRGDVDIQLNSKEFRILEVLLRNKNRIVTKGMLLDKVWNMNFDPCTSVIESHVSRLRSKVDKPFDTALITTVRGAGYRLDD